MKEKEALETTLKALSMQHKDVGSEEEEEAAESREEDDDAVERREGDRGGGSGERGNDATTEVNMTTP